MKLINTEHTINSNIEINAKINILDKIFSFLLIIYYPLPYYILNNSLPSLENYYIFNKNLTF